MVVVSSSAVRVIAAVDHDVCDLATPAGLTSWESRAGMRTLQQAASAPDSDLSGRLILAANQTDRRDVLDDFKVYRGGWDIRNQHYWSVSARMCLWSPGL